MCIHKRIPYPAYHLPVGCYKNPAVARQFTYDSTATYHLRHFLNSYYNSSNEVFPSISDKCKLDSRLATEWTAHTIGLDHNNTLFMYWGSANGLMVTYPGINFDISFDNRFRPWYYTATALGADTLAVSTPYLGTELEGFGIARFQGEVCINVSL
eukprot:171191-Amorphochlora_amoeboformis.AAC.1